MFNSVYKRCNSNDANAWRDTGSGELHATFVESSPSGSHALPLMALSVACQWPGTADTADANNLPKPHRDDSRGHAQARDDTITSNSDFPAPAS